jgi:hypothetical protein
VNTSVAIAEIASKTVLWLAVIWAGVRLAPGVLPRLQITNPRGQGRAAARVEPAAALEDQGEATAA